MNHALLFTLLSLGGTPALPPSLPLPRGFSLNAATWWQHSWDEATFHIGESDKPLRGKVTRSYLERAADAPKAPEPAFALWKPLLEKGGWKVVGHAGDGWTLTRGTGDAAQWLDLNLPEFNDPLVTVVEPGAQPTKLTLKPPAATPEKVSDKEDWPFVGHFPGAVLDSTGLSDVPLTIPNPSHPEEPVLVASAMRIKSYTPPATLSRLELRASTEAALKAAGWEVLPTADDSYVLAHWTRDGRNLWLTASRAADDSNTGLTYAVADIGADDWGKALDKECHVALTGVTFDFDKATLRPESTVVLEKAQKLLASRASLSIEVQGHTDATGSDAYNETLSGKRAEAVKGWLVAHGIPAARLTSKGWGKRMPIADNETEVGRAKNRRVELACRK